ncbi:MAG: hypothetical protein ABFE07_19050 [Armatimonadia bacterium]
MPPDNDDYLDVELDDEPEGAPENVLDVSLEDAAPPKSPRKLPSTPLKPEAKLSEPELPMISGGICERCGYALRPLEDHCPRCGRRGAEAAPPAEAPDRLPAPAELPEVAPAARRSGCSVWAVAGSLTLVLAIAGLLAWLWLQPRFRAQREYRAGLQAQLAGDFKGARFHYMKALELNPNMGLAALMMGTTYLRIGDPAMVSSIDQLVKQAMWGQTGDLDRADQWFRKAIAIGAQLPASTELADPKINTPPRLRAFARAFMALTALVRASAALQADQLEDGMKWLGVAQQEGLAALTDDPGNEQAQKILGSIPPNPPTTAPSQ